MRLPDRQRSRAVLLAVGRYADHSLQDLPEARAAGAALHSTLTDPKHGTLPSENCVLIPEDAVIQEVGRHLRAAADDAEDVLLVYYAGHGLLSRRRHELHLALTGTPADEPGFGGIPFDLVRDTCVDSPAACKIVILDCCYSGRALGRTQSATADTIIQDTAIEGAAVLTSVPPNTLSLVLKGEPYPAFSGRLLRLLREGLPSGPHLLTLPLIHQRLQHELKAVGVRLPQIEYSNTVGRLAFFRNRAPDTSSTSEVATPRAMPGHEQASAELLRTEPDKAAELLALTDRDLAATMLVNAKPHTAAEVLELMEPSSAGDVLIAMFKLSAVDERDNSSPCHGAAVLCEMESALGAEVLGSMDSDLAADVLVRVHRYQRQGVAFLRTDAKVAQLLFGLALDQAAALMRRMSPSEAAELLAIVHQYPSSAGQAWALSDWTAELIGRLDLEHGTAVLSLLPDEVVAELDPGPSR